LNEHPQGPFWLDPDGDPAHFPDPAYALEEPNGLLAVGGDLSPARLLNAYRQGIFPWYSDDQPILWWSPAPRAVLFPEQLHISRSLKKRLRSGAFRVTLDEAFTEVIEACSTARGAASGTWITDEMKQAYTRLHRIGFAHSVEVWQADELVGGLYGVSLGKVFFGESMFSRVTDASKLALVHLVRQLMAWEFALIDCQVGSAHLRSLGACEIPRDEFLDLLDRYCEPVECHQGQWRIETDEEAGR
jgi:leucyl/phenylalanyl-tRNA---protein transferase